MDANDGEDVRRVVPHIEPLKVVAGARESAAAVLARLNSQNAQAAPVFLRGRTIGVLTSRLANDAARHGLGRVAAKDLVSGGAPRVSPAASPASMRRASLGIAPALLVGEHGGPLVGILSRLEIERAAPRRWSAAAKRDMRRRLARLLGAERAQVLARAGALAGRSRMPLYLVGGVVRDLLRGVPAKDLDLVVEGDVATFAAELGRDLSARVTRHDTFGTAVLELAGGARIDIATARHESYEAPARLPSVAAGTLLEDLQRRDVTINCLALRLDGAAFGGLIDEMGGQRDLRAGILRVNHSLSLTEDPTRAFRIARFAARFGFRFSGETLKSLRLARSAGAFEALTGERLFREFSLMTAEPDPSAAIARCARLGLLAHLGPGLRWDVDASRGVRQLSSTWNEEITPLRRTLLVLMVLSLRARPAQRDALAARLRISGKAAGRLREAPRAAMRLARSLAKARGPRDIVRACEQAPHDVMALAWAVGGASARRALRFYLRALENLRLSVTGDTLREMGMPAGPGYAAILAEIRRARLEGRISDGASERRMALRLMARDAARDAGVRQDRH